MPPPSRPRLLALLVAGAFFMEFLDGTVIATALPQMARTFGVHPADLSIGMSAYLLTLAVFLPLSGWMADRFGPRSVFCSALAIFTGASLLCGFSTGPWSFTAARVIQGIGGAMMVPVGRLVVLRSTAKKDLMRAIATLTWPALAAPILAPPLGGFITTYADWRWVFFINLPLGLAALLAGAILVPNEPAGGRPPLDWRGFALTSLACLGLMGAFELLGQERVDWIFVAALTAPSLGLGAAAIRHARRHAAPILQLEALRLPTFATAAFGGSLFRIAISSVPFLLPLMFQVGFGLDAFRSGLLVLAVFVGNVVIKPFTTPILRRFGFRRTMVANGIAAGLAIASCALITPQTPVPLTLAILFVGGLARSLQFTAVNTLAFADVHEEWMSGANTLFNMLQQMSFGMGIAAGALALRIGRALTDAGGEAAPSAAFRIAFVLVSLIAFLAVADVLRVPKNAGAHLTGRD